MIHGTNAAYRRHLANDEPACERCLRGVARYENQRRLDILHGRDRLVDKGPSIRKLQSLMAMGWTAVQLARKMGRADRYVTVLLSRTSQPRVSRNTAAEVDALWERLCMTPGPSRSALIRARNKGWKTPLAWEDIDAGILAETEQTGRVPLDRLDEDLIEEILQTRDFSIRTSQAEKREIMRRWLAMGKTEKSLCDLTGWRAGRYSKAA